MPFSGITLNPTENVLVIREESDLPDEFDQYTFYHLLYSEAEYGPGLYFSPDEVLLEPVSTSSTLDESDVFIGIALDSPDVSVSSSGTVISLSIEASGGGDIRFVFSDGVYTLDCTPADTVTLTVGTDIAPVESYVYLLQSTKTLTASTSGWPATEYAPIATVLCQSAASAQTDGLYKVHAWTDHVKDAVNGHLAHLNYWIRQQSATWAVGVGFSTSVGAATFDVITAAGSILQLHPHAYPAFNTSTGSELMVVNDSTTAYKRVGNLVNELTDSAGVTMANKYYNLVLWGVVSEDAADCQLMINLPNASYTIQADAETDIDQTASYDIPPEFTGTGFLIARLTMRNQIGGNTFSEIPVSYTHLTLPTILLV